MLDRSLLLTLAEYIGVVAVVMIGAISPGFAKRRPLIFKYPRREGLVSLSLFVLIFFLNLILAFRGVSSPVSRLGSDFGALWPRLLTAFFSLLAFGAALTLRRQPWLSIGWSKHLMGSSFRLGLALVFLTVFLRGQFMTLFHGISASQGYLLLAWVLIAFIEETIFRGYLQLRLTSWLGDIPGWLGTAFLFVIWQIPFLLADPVALPVNLALAALRAVLLGWIMRRTGHVLAPAMWRAVSEWLFYI